MTEQEISGDAAPEQSPPCPKCKGQMWDNRATKRNPKAPDYKCKTDGCDGIIWPPRDVGAAPSVAKPTGTPDNPACPVCGGKMWDDRLSKRNPRAPDFKCRNKPRAQGAPGCEGVIWPPRDGQRPAATKTTGSAPRANAAPRPAPPPPPSGSEREFSDDEVPDFGDDDLPF